MIKQAIMSLTCSVALSGCIAGEVIEIAAETVEGAVEITGAVVSGAIDITGETVDIILPGDVYCADSWQDCDDDEDDDDEDDDEDRDPPALSRDRGALRN